MTEYACTHSISIISMLSSHQPDASILSVAKLSMCYLCDIEVIKLDGRDEIHSLPNVDNFNLLFNLLFLYKSYHIACIT